MKHSKQSTKLTIDQRNPRTIKMNAEGLTQDDTVQCWFCHTHRKVSEMTVHHLLEQRLCVMHPWHEDKVYDPVWMVFLCGGKLGCHEKVFNYYLNQTVNMAIKQTELERQISYYKSVIAGKPERKVSDGIDRAQGRLEQMQNTLVDVILELEGCK